MRAKGVYPILPTPFKDSGEVDVESLRRLITYQKQTGVNGVALLGFMGEAHKLSFAERRLVLQVGADEAAGELEMWVGVRALGTMGAIEQAQMAESEGANAVFVAPIPVQNDEALYQHFKAVKEALTIPVIIHDYPASFSAILSPDLITRLATDGICPYIKLEEPPTGPKVSKVRELSQDKIGIFGGLGAIYLLEELERGALGIASGFSFSDVLVRICELYANGQHDAAARTFHHYAPLIRYEFQPKMGIALRKYAYYRRGIFSSPHERSPAGYQLDAYTAKEYERIIERCGLSLHLTVKYELV